MKTNKLSELIRHKYGPIYRIVVAGRSIVVIADQGAVSFLDRDPAKVFSNEEVFTRLIEGVFGITTNSVFVHDVMRQKLFPLVGKWLSHPRSSEDLLQSMDPELVTQLTTFGNSASSSIVNLSELVSRTLYVASCTAFFGPSFPATETLPDYQLIDARLPLLITGMPFVASDAVQARKRMLDRMISFIGSWWESDEEPEGVSTMVLDFLHSMKDAHLSKREAAGLLSLFLWGSQINTWYMAFWLITNIITGHDTMERIQAEIDGLAFQTCKREGTKDHSQTPLVDSAITENLRWATTSSIIRRATKDTQIMFGDAAIVIEKGDYILADVKAVHHDRDIFRTGKLQYRPLSKIGESSQFCCTYANRLGRRCSCKGKSMALLQMRQIVIRLFQLYTVKPISGVAEKAQSPHLRKPNSSLGSLSESSRQFYVELTLRREKLEL
ncbi:hypothetical protein NLJ89_g10243 [Agrocybe chaxingu]|uniref:Cytochrome P450 n=1 Tax=Agrocybe chaxingu TaxID=84603 RepID=A0A9W8JYI9_9AGAR|nr:hypothetical protein NLJ89_g10243 [Agrocybe chaxingu]